MFFQDCKHRRAAELAQGLQVIRCLTALAVCLFEHVDQEAELAKHTVLVFAISRCVMQCQVADDWCEAIELQKSIRI